MSRPPLDAAGREALAARWRAAWPQALDTWSRFTRLRDPRLCASRVEAASEGLTVSCAMIRLADQSVVIDLEQVHTLGLDDHAVEILAHEIGHHVLAPASATDHVRLLARIRRALPTLERHVPLVANLYTDLLINDRLQRQAGLRMADVYRRFDAAAAGAGGGKQAALWTLYLRIYETLWKLEKGALGSAAADEHLDTDAWLGARVVRVYAGDWLRGAGKFATLLLPYLVESTDLGAGVRYLHDTGDAAEGCLPTGVLDVEGDEVDDAVHPLYDPLVTGTDDDADGGNGAIADADADAAPDAGAAKRGQAREPFEYGELLKAAGLKLSDDEIAVRYYRERALPHLVPFPTRAAPVAPEPELEGLEPWEAGMPFDEIDWLQSLMQSPRLIPGMTTVRRSSASEPEAKRENVPVDLDMYVDSSGSMPHPQVSTSYLALAGAIVALSALRAGASVRVTLWSGKEQYLETAGFVRDEDAILRVLTGYFGGGTCFPIHRLRDTWRTPRARPAHILMVSDDGISTMFDKDEKGGSGWDVAAGALAACGAGGTMALNLPRDWDGTEHAWMRKAYAPLRRARDEQGWDIHAVPAYEDLVAFARAFSLRHYAVPRARPGR